MGEVLGGLFYRNFLNSACDGFDRKLTVKYNVDEDLELNKAKRKN